MSIDDDKQSKKAQSIDFAKLCPKCGTPMVLKTAKKSKYKGHEFWGCPKYPDCKGLIPLDGEKNEPKKQSKELQVFLSPEEKSVKDKVSQVLHILNEKEQKVLLLRLGIGCEPQTLHAIAKIMNLSRESVRLMVKKSIEKIKLRQAKIL